MAGTCMAGGMHSREHVWQGACVAGACMAGGMHGRGWHAWGTYMARGHVWQERWPLQQTVHIHTSYFNAFLLIVCCRSACLLTNQMPVFLKPAVISFTAVVFNQAGKNCGQLLAPTVSNI